VHVSKIVLLFVKLVLTFSLKSKVSNWSSISFKICSIFDESAQASLSLKAVFHNFYGTLQED